MNMERFCVSCFSSQVLINDDLHFLVVYFWMLMATYH